MKNIRLHKITYRLLALLLVTTTLWSCSIMGAYATSDEAMETTPICGNIEHSHTDSCYTTEKNMTCGLEGDDTHVHEGTCYEYEKKLVCTQTVVEPHTHGDACYTMEQAVTCGKEETTGHTHDEGCYETVSSLVCTKEVHVHDTTCQTEEKNLICQETESDTHTHGDDCYEITLASTCTKEVHEHDTSCWTKKENLICQKVECEAHTHEESCYTENKTVTCGKEETAGHTHGDSCYELQATTQLCEIHVHSEDCYAEKTELTCELPEHTHSEACYDRCTCTPVDGVHQSDCALYIPAKCEHCGIDLVDGAVHAETCLTRCTCAPVDDVHQNGCALYVPTKCEYCGVELAENAVHAKDCLTRCTCDYANDTHAENCMVHCTCEPTNGVHGKDCALYKETTINSDYGVTVFGSLPETAELVVQIPSNSDLANIFLNTNEQIAFAYDISILVDDAEYQPLNPVEVTVHMQVEMPNDGFGRKIIVQHITASGIVEIVPSRQNDDGTVTFWANGFSTYVGTIALDGATEVTPENGQIIFDLYYGPVALTDDAFAGYNMAGKLITGIHVESTRYIIQQSHAETATTNTITVGVYDIDITLPTGSSNFPTIDSITSTPVNKSFLIELAGVNIRAADQVSAFSVNNKGNSIVAVILKNGTTNYLYSGINRAGLEKSGGHTSDGTMVLTCEAGYTAWLANPNAGHTDSDHFSACSASVCGTIDARSGNAWKNKSTKNTYYAGAGIGTHGCGANGSSTEGVGKGNNALVNVTIAGGNIYALGAYGNSRSNSSGGGANIGTGSGRTSSITSGTITGLKLTGGTYHLWRGDNSAACIGGGYRSGYVNMEIFGGNITTSNQPGGSYTSLTTVTKVRAPGIGGGGGGTSSPSPAGATVTIHGGQITTFGQYGSAIGAGAGGDDGAGSNATVNIYGGTIHATTTKGAGNGAGAAIGAGGSLDAGKAGSATVNIYGGTIVASSELGADIGGGGTNSAETTGIGGDGTVTITGGTITAMFGGIGGGRANAGIGGEADVTISGGTITASGVGGGDSKLSHGGNCTLEISGGTVTVNNQTGVSIGGGNGGTGGNGGDAILIVSGTAVLRAGSIGGGSTTNPGGSIGKADVTISGGLIQGQVVMAKGSDTPCTFTMTGGTLDNSNRIRDGFYFVRNDGGAVYMDDPNGVASIFGGTIQNCSAKNGGAVYMTAGNFALSGEGTIQNCAATYNGGAVYLGGGTMTISGGEISSNTAQNNGGGAYLGGGTLTVSGGNIGKALAANTAVNGGGAFVSGGELNISGGSISHNTATLHGGGAYVENGTVIMSGGKVDNNTAYGGGGGMLVSADNSIASVSIYSGSVSGNSAGTTGGAVAVVGQTSETQIAVTLGVNKDHSFMPFNHEEGTVTYTHSSCPEIKNNSSSGRGGAIYIFGGKSTQLNMFCLTATGNNAEGGDSLSNFMMVEGGTVVVSSSETKNTNPSDGTDSKHGHVSIVGTVHVLGGDVSLYGATNNPKFEFPITVDVVGSGGSFNDYRYSDEYYKLLYFENFLAPGASSATGQYTAYQVPKGMPTTISGVIYSHVGYSILGWCTTPTIDLNGKWYDVGAQYPSNEELLGADPFKDLTIYAIWKMNGYTVEYYPNIPAGETYTGTMGPQQFTYNVAGNLKPNAFEYPGYIFTGWLGSNGEIYADEAEIYNLTAKDGAVIGLYALWTKCEHNGTHDTNLDGIPDTYLVYTANGNVLRRDCSCGGQRLHAILTAKDMAYDGSAHGAEIYFPEGVYWPVTLSYTGTTYGGAAYASTDSPTQAGTYTAMLMAIADPNEPKQSVQVQFTIAKADQAAPSKAPEFDAVDSTNAGGNTVTVLKIKAVPPSLVGTTAEYRLAYYDGGIWKFTNWGPEDTIADGYACIIEPDVALVNYYVEARYAENGNYNASAAIRGEQVFFYEGDVKILVECDPGITAVLSNYTDPHTGVSGGVNVNASYDSTKYYLPTGDFQAISTTYIVDTAGNEVVGGTQAVLTRTDKGAYLLSSIPTSCKIIVKITGTKAIPQIAGKVAEKQVFGTIIHDETPEISRDSAFTAHYTVSGYDNTVYDELELTFLSQIPAGTTIILLDKANGSYWYYSAPESGANSVALTVFTRMGGSDKLAISGSDLAYQFIVDFSRTATGCIGNSIAMTLAAEKKDAENTNVPHLSASVNVALEAQSTFALGVTAGNNGLAQKFTLDYTASAGAASKWDNRAATLVLTPPVGIPADATLLVTLANGQKINWPKSGNGTYIIPLSVVRDEIVTVELTSALFPVGNASYEFTARWIISNSAAAKAPLNGFVGASETTVTFTKAAETPPAMKVTGSTHLVAINDSTPLTATVTYTLPPHAAGYTVTAELLRKGDDGEYISTAWNRTLASSGSQLKVSLAGLGLPPGSFCLVVTMAADNGATTVLQVPYYFIAE